MKIKTVSRGFVPLVFLLFSLVAAVARAEDQDCLVCHEALRQQKVVHAAIAMGCPSCHSSIDAGEIPHKKTNNSPKGLSSEPPELCYGCHLQVRAKFALTEHHKVNEGVVSCVDCHRPHGSRNPSMRRAANDTTCFRCHGDKEGPWVFEHAGLVAEGCLRCHDPHGSVNRHLLVRQQVAQLCYECHTVTPGTHLQPRFRDCTRCHAAIHGSNVDPRFLER